MCVHWPVPCIMSVVCRRPCNPPYLSGDHRKGTPYSPTRPSANARKERPQLLSSEGNQEGANCTISATLKHAVPVRAGGTDPWTGSGFCLRRTQPASGRTGAVFAGNSSFMSAPREKKKHRTQNPKNLNASPNTRRPYFPVLPNLYSTEIWQNRLVITIQSQGLRR